MDTARKLMPWHTEVEQAPPPKLRLGVMYYKRFRSHAPAERT
jgi:hypothetical protein